MSLLSSEIPIVDLQRHLIGERNEFIFPEVAEFTDEYGDKR